MIFDDDGSTGTILDGNPDIIGTDFWIHGNCGALTGADSCGPGGGMVNLMELAWMIAEASGD